MIQSLEFSTTASTSSISALNSVSTTSTSSPAQSTGTRTTSSLSTNTNSLGQVSPTISNVSTPAVGSQSAPSCAAAITKSSGIGTGAIAGITIAAIILVISLVLGGFLWYQRRRSRKGNAVNEPAAPGSYEETPEYMETKPLYEMDYDVNGRYNLVGIAEVADTRA